MKFKLMKYFQFLLFLTLSASFSAQNYPPKEFQAQVIGVKDGDTVEVLWENTAYVIRLLHIDCPEKKQAFGNKAKKEMSQLVYGKSILIRWKTKDRNKRLLGELFLGDQNINQILVSKGLAWHYKKYSKEKIYDQIELQARKQKLNIWSQPNPIAPWDYRKMKKNLT